MSSLNVLDIDSLGKRYSLGGKRNDDLRGSLRNFFNLSRSAKSEFWALKNVSFNVTEGEVVGIIGKNGAGKSTLLKVLSRITPLTKGRVEIKGRMASLLEVGTGFHAELTGLENIYLNGAILGMKRLEVRNKLEEIIDFAGVSQFINTPVKHYSSGMYVRLAFAVAAHLEPEILLIDEVLAVGDAEFQKKSLGKMQEVSHSSGRTILFVSHQMNFVSKLCNRAILLERGEALDYGSDVTGCISKYFDSGEEDSSGVWRPVSNKDGVYGVFNIRRFGFSDSDGGSAPNNFSNSDAIRVKLHVTIKKLSPDIEFGIVVRDLAGTTLFHSFHYDAVEDSWPRFKEGENEIQIEMPCRFFNEGEYSVQLIAGLRQIKWYVAPGADQIVVHFKISGGLSDSPLWHQKREGLLAPVLTWSNSN